MLTARKNLLDEHPKFIPTIIRQAKDKIETTALMYTDQAFPNQPPVHWSPRTAAGQQAIDWEAFLWTAGAVGLLALLTSALDAPARRHCGTCGRVGHDTRTCPQNPAKRVRLRFTKTGWCSCCNRRRGRTEAHHYAGPADGTKGREMCTSCHFVCGHGGNWQNMGTNPRFCRLKS